MVERYPEAGQWLDQTFFRVHPRVTDLFDIKAAQMLRPWLQSVCIVRYAILIGMSGSSDVSIHRGFEDISLAQYSS